MVLGPITTAIHYWRKALRVAFQAWRTHSRNSDTNHWTPTSRPVAVRQNPLNRWDWRILDAYCQNDCLPIYKCCCSHEVPIQNSLAICIAQHAYFARIQQFEEPNFFLPDSNPPAQTSASHPQIGDLPGVSHDSHQRIPCLSTSSPAHRCCHRPHHQLSRLSRLWRLWRSLHPRHRPWV